MQNTLMKTLYITAAAALLAACSSATPTNAQNARNTDTPSPLTQAVLANTTVQTDEAIFAGGCFWCVESDFEKLPGVIEVISGYSGGDMLNPTYRNHGRHVEVAKIIFDPSQVSYDALLDYYWRHIDPTDSGGQFCDRGNAYIPVIYARPDQIEAANASKAALSESKPFDAPIAVPVLPAKTFWDAEGYHQDYYKKNPVRYNFYRRGCGRDARIKDVWGS